MFDYISSHTFGLLAAFCIFVLPFLVIGAVGLVLTMRDRAYDRGYDDAWNNAIRAQRDNRILV